MTQGTLQENLKDALQIVETIITQPLHIGSRDDGISLATAAKNFSNQQPENSDLKKILVNFVTYPESTQMLLQELELISRDLRL
jgi:hypothetical protein